jgi:UDP-N-acetylmuramoylalanine--D-glutamate ligase
MTAMDGLAEFKDRQVGVLGLARSGLATARALVAAGARVVAFDDRPDALGAATGLGAVPGKPADVAGLAILVVSPGVPLTHPAPHPVIAAARAAGVALTSDIDLFVDSLGLAHSVIAVTGTNGKSTTSALIHHLLMESGRDARLGGNIGRAVFDLEPPGKDTIYVLEVSSFQLDLCTRLHPYVAVWLNLTPDHLDRHGDLDGYIKAKRRVFAAQDATDWAVIGIDDEPSRRLADEIEAGGLGPRVARISVAGGPVEHGVYVEDGDIVDAREARPRRVAGLRSLSRLRGEHNWQNAAAAIAAVLPFVPVEAIQPGLESFEGLAHRMEQVAEEPGIVWINDSKATNPDAAARSLDCFENIFWIAGGKPKPGGFKALRPHMARVRAAFLIGRAAAEIAADLGDIVPTRQVDTLENAVAAAGDAAREAALPQAAVLLAPACASFDQFNSFEHRGDRFRELVRARLEASAA